MIIRRLGFMLIRLRRAVVCLASLSVAFVASAQIDRINNWSLEIYIIMGIMLLLLIILAVTLFVLYRKMKHLNRLRERLSEANYSKILYINQFLKLCSIYMDKLNQLCHIIERKISAGKADELLRMTKSGHFIEDQTPEFYAIIDNAFLHIYPDFVEKVNALLRPECQIVLQSGELLNTDLRILAIRRMGIDDAASAAQMLNYSLNTIYAYRNRRKARAINRDTFEADIMKIEASN